MMNALPMMNIPCWARDNKTLVRFGDFKKPIFPDDDGSLATLFLTREMMMILASSPYKY